MSAFHGRVAAAILMCAVSTTACGAKTTALPAPPEYAHALESQSTIAQATQCAPITGGHRKDAVALNAVLTEDQKRYGLRAVIFSASRNGQPVLVTARGDSTTGVPASTAMHFRVGQPAELMMTSMLLQLVAEKRIGLADTVATWFPSYPYAHLATVQMLGLSRTGFGDYVYGPADPARRIEAFGDLLDDNPYRSFTTEELIRRSIAPYQVPQFTNPGGNWAYSHTNYVMLGSILESVTREPYPRLINERIFERAGLHETVFPTTSAIAPPVLHAYTSERGRYEDSTGWNPSWTSFSGNVNSTVCDLVAWQNALGTGMILPRGSFAELTTRANVGLSKNTPTLYFGFGTIVANGWLEGAGNYFGWHTATAYYPPLRIAFAVTITETPSTKDGAAALNDMLTHISSVFTADAPIAFPSH